MFSFVTSITVISITFGVGALVLAFLILLRIGVDYCRRNAYAPVPAPVVQDSEGNKFNKKKT
jgi:hypothetical protein